MKVQSKLTIGFLVIALMLIVDLGLSFFFAKENANLVNEKISVLKIRDKWNDFEVSTTRLLVSTELDTDFHKWLSVKKDFESDLLDFIEYFIYKRSKQASSDIQNKLSGLKRLWQIVSKETSTVEKLYNTSEIQDIVHSKRPLLMKYGEYSVTGKFPPDLLLIVDKVNHFDVYSQPFINLLSETVSFIDKSVSRQIRRMRLVTLGIGIGILLISILYSLLFARIFTKNIKKIHETTNRVSSGDFTGEIRIRAKDEIGELAESINKINENISGIIANSIETANHFEENTEILTERSGKMTEMIMNSLSSLNEIDRRFNKWIEEMESKRTSLQSIVGITEEGFKTLDNMKASVEESSAEVEEMARTTIAVAENGSKMSEISKQLLEHAKNTANKTGEASSIITGLETKMSEIQNITKVITAIASQTNLLAMNASIEAAHAGEAGKGFAVVAEEIRNLAENSARSASEIKKILSETKDSIENSVESFSKIVEVSEKTIEKIETISQLIEQNDEATSEEKEAATQLINAIRKLKEMFQRVEEAFEREKKETDRIVESFKQSIEESEKTGRAIFDVNRRSKEIKGELEEFNEILSSERELAKKLKNILSEFKIKRNNETESL